MFNRTTSNTSVAGAAAAKSRRPFGDVSNATRSGSGKNKTVVKKPNGVKTRSMSGPVANDITTVVRQSALGNHVEDKSVTLPLCENFLQRAMEKADPNSYQVTGNVDNIDDRDSEDPTYATDYVDEMYLHFRQVEDVTSVRPWYMEKQPHINERMRAILIDWLVEVHLKFKLVPETLYLTVNLIDRYLERQEVARPKLQLVGVTSLLIASKYEEIYPPELRDLVYICDRAYTRQDIIDMEEKILKTLEYQITIPSAHVFLVRYLKAGHADKRIVQISCYLLDGTLQSYSLMNYLPSQLAAAAVYIARRVVGRNSWSPTLLRYGAYCEEEITPVARAILAEKASASQELRAVNKKYASNRYGAVASMEIPCDF